jgi:hypothetical protein
VRSAAVVPAARGAAAAPDQSASARVSRSPGKSRPPRRASPGGGATLAPLGVRDGNRTRDTRDHNPVLYQLSYSHRNNERQ